MSVEDADAPAEGEGQGEGRGRAALALVVALLVGVGTVVAFWGRGRVAPAMRGTLEHMASLQGRNAQACSACHRPGGSGPIRPSGHTPREDCWNCHQIAR